MEFLNNIWIALSTPNEGLVDILLIPAVILENILSINLIFNIMNIKTSLLKKIVYIILMSIICIISMFILPIPFNTFANYIFMILLIYFIFKLSLPKSILATLFSNIIFVLLGVLVSNPYMTIFNISSIELETIPVYRSIYLCIIYFLLFLFILFFKYTKINFSFSVCLDKPNKLVIFFNTIIGLFTLIIQSIFTFYYTDILPVSITFFNFFTLLLYFSISIYSLSKINKLALTTQKLETTEEYNNTLKILHDNVRCFKHDFDNIVTTIGGYIRTNDMEGLKKYYLQLEDDCQKVNNLYVLNPEIVNNDGIYNLIVKKYNEAEQKNVKVNISFLLDLNTLKMKIYEFGRILGILLDNAIEASSECEEKIINLTFRNDTKNSRQLVKIENTYSNKNVDTEKIFEKGISGKENHTGLGLWEVNKLLHKNNNLALFTTKNDKYFSQQLEIYY